MIFDSLVSLRGYQEIHSTHSSNGREIRGKNWFTIETAALDPSMFEIDSWSMTFQDYLTSINITVYINQYHVFNKEKKMKG